MSAISFAASAPHLQVPPLGPTNPSSQVPFYKRSSHYPDQIATTMQRCNLVLPPHICFMSPDCTLTDFSSFKYACARLLYDTASLDASMATV